mmetsp:Transcript_23419/g.26943  ORF Transcript_23419/g.26943 Transcript_23419/m.26943 type:complete len:83 (+) Transcript_23419:177-425(+)
MNTRRSIKNKNKKRLQDLKLDQSFIRTEFSSTELSSLDTSSVEICPPPLKYSLSKSSSFSKNNSCDTPSPSTADAKAIARRI